MTSDPRRRLPSVEAVLVGLQARLVDVSAASPNRAILTRLVQARISVERQTAATDDGHEVPDLQALVGELAEEARALMNGRLFPVINATGVLLQTNLGRAPLSEETSVRLGGVAMGYSNLEYDIEAGRRSDRAGTLRQTFEALLGVPAVVVNNNAASLLLALATVARGREVIVSRGELIEIGGSFRLPDVMRLSGARLVEVGTTNRTRLADYREAITPRTAMILKVHTSNFQVVGFVESVPVDHLAVLAQERNIVIMEDLGSGSLLPTEEAGLAHEPTVQDTLAAGVDLVAFSGDKLLGGPQAGLVAGRAELVAKLGKNALYRALRPDKLTLVALEATLGSYLRGQARTELPLWRMLMETAGSTRIRATAWVEAVRTELGNTAPPCHVVDVESTVGGGTLPGQVLNGFGLAVGTPGRRPSAATLAERLRRSTPTVIGRVHHGRLILDPRTVVDPEDDLAVANVLVSALRQ
jgi:L-seryl-tRNA(Ser) seleniumtransferase